jgi:hypothetical protein
MAASVEVRGTRVRVRLRDRTTGAAFTRTLRMSSPDVSSAEWIVEAPSSCDDAGDCRELPLGDFGTLSFAHASATTTRGHTGTIADAAYRRTRIRLSASDGGGPGPGFASAASDAGAIASSLNSSGSAFSVSYSATASGTGSETTFLRSGPA